MNKSVLAVALKERGRKGLRRRAPVGARPDRYELEYRRWLYGLIQQLETEVKESLIATLPDLLAERKRELPNRNDSWVDRIEDVMARVQQLAERGRERAVQMSLELGGEINQFNRQQQVQIAMATLGVNPFSSSEDWLTTELQSFARENVALIKDLTDSTIIQDIEGIAQRGVRGGESLGDLTDEIEKRFKVARSRARLIARDQVSKLNGQLTQYRQQEIGIETYVWRIADNSERTRDDHRAMDGRVCRWDDATVYLDETSGQWRPRSGIGGVELHPGQDYQCRCNGVANIDGLLDELGL
jgi:SPP1 gp7 family putative phage head morphogenesis protein